GIKALLQQLVAAVAVEIFREQPACLAMPFQTKALIGKQVMDLRELAALVGEQQRERTARHAGLYVQVIATVAVEVVNEEETGCFCFPDSPLGGAVPSSRGFYLMDWEPQAHSGAADSNG